MGRFFKCYMCVRCARFFLTLPLSFYISFFPLADYYSCGLRGPFSGAYYVKDLKMCEQFEYHPESGSDDVSAISVTPRIKNKMNTPVYTQTIITGADPRNLPEFNAIREEINKISHPSQPEMNWKLVESLALTIFKSNGVDLHTATYYTLARTRMQGLAGFSEGVELLAAMINHEWDKFWPQNSPARTEMLDWFNTRIGNILRQQISLQKMICRCYTALSGPCNISVTNSSKWI